MIGLNKEQLIKIIDKINTTQEIKKKDLHSAIASAIEENNKQLLKDIQKVISKDK